MELLFLAALGYVIWRVTSRKSSRPRPTGQHVPPPPSGRPIAFSSTYATFSAEGRDGWPPAVLKAVEGLFEVANADEPTTLGKMRTVAKRLSSLGTTVADHLEPIVESLDEQREDPAVPDPLVDALQAVLDSAYDLTGAEDEAAEAEDEVEVDVIGYAQDFVDAWQKAPNIPSLES